ncbi:MAG: hypothetical protein AAF219_10945 [Myxococcota bacterium]
MLVSTGEAYTVRANVTVAPVTTTIRVVAVEVAIGKRQGLPKRGVIDCDALVTTSKAILSEGRELCPRRNVSNWMLRWPSRLA